ncbi:major paralogous domain-containing protein [Fibrobacter sp. UWR3]|nr:major paralogous domain-containing protein [Fibrobacter sp. UWR3]
MFKFACFFSFICICLFLVACGDGGTSEPILYPREISVETSSSMAESSSFEIPESSEAQSSSSASFLCIIGTDEDCDYGMLIDERDGQIYKTMKVGGQVWMAENLNYQIGVKHCYHDSCAQYGRFYSWSTAMDSAGVFSTNGLGCGDGLMCSPDYPVRGICPAGWHLPSKFEIEPLVPELGGLMEIAAQAEDSSTPSIFAERFLTRTYMWSSTDENENMTSFLSFNKESYSLYPATCMKYRLLSVRCVKGQSAEQNMDKLLSFNARSSSSSVSQSSSSSVSQSSSSCDVHVSYGEMTDERDAHVYRTMTIDGCTTKKNESGEYRVKVPRQTWMAENLNYAYLQPTSTLDSSSWCYNNEPDSCVKYGRLYLWSAAMDSAALFSEDTKGCGFYRNVESWQKCHVTGMGRGVCPEGWHLPTRQEYGNLQSTTPLVCKMKNDAQVTNGFLLQFGGLYYAEPDCCTVYNYTNGEHFFEWGEDASFFWFASEGTIGSEAYSVMTEEISCVPSTGSTYKFFAFSVRCVKDVPDIE